MPSNLQQHENVLSVLKELIVICILVLPLYYCRYLLFFTLFNPFGMGSIHFCVFEDFNMLNYNGSVNEKTFSNNFDASASELLENHEEMFSRYW